MDQSELLYLAGASELQHTISPVPPAQVWRARERHRRHRVIEIRGKVRILPQ